MTLPTDRTTASTRAEHVADHNTLHGLHNAYEGTEPADFDPTGTAATAVAAHAGAGDPHPGYLTTAEGNAAYDATGAAAAAVAAHAGLTDPHSGYRLESVPIAAADVAADVATQAELDAVSALADAAFPWLINVDVFHTSVDQVNFDTVTAAASLIMGGFKLSTGAQNARIAWDVVLHAGTWTVELLHRKDANVGIYSVQLDDVEKGTIDGYVTPAVSNVRSSVTGITVATTGKKRLSLKMLTKNASSSSYFGVISSVILKRTA